ncbi:MAG: polyphosphate kinase 1 [Anaerolineae bacterium]|nr:polyphosphate kinase 1 [Anaerolineae bacterium]
MANTVLNDRPETLSESIQENGKPDVDQPNEQGSTKQPEGVESALPRAVIPQDVPEDADLTHPALYFNRELSWIDFNWRVLHLAVDERTPLLERVRFVAITASNLDEFCQKRVGGLKRQEAAGVQDLSPDGRTPSGQLAIISKASGVMHQALTALWENVLKSALAEQIGVVICDYDDLDEPQQQQLYEYFQNQIYPILTPLAVDPGRPFPFISNLSLSLAIVLQDRKNHKKHFARLKIPTNLGRWLPIKKESDDGKKYFLPIEQLITHHVRDLFPGMDIVSVHPFRITRNADLRRDEEEATDLLFMISKELRARRFAAVVRLEIAAGAPAIVRDWLMEELELSSDDIYDVEGLIDLTSCHTIANLDFPEFQYVPWEPIIPAPFSQLENDRELDVNLFDLIKQSDVLVHHPYESFAGTVQRLIEEAVDDEKVLAIKQTLYRTSDESPIIKALVKAAEKGKQVAVLVEVKARFDEANNIEWGQMLEQAGVHVAYGLVGLKIHAKATLIIRQEEDGPKTYCHIGTGNYHSKTARLYTDLGLITSDPVIGRDLVNLFHYLTGYAPEQPYKKAIIAPRDMRDHINKCIQQEIECQKQYNNGRIIAKMNALDDVRVIRELYQASQAGVQIDLIIRGHSRLRPALPGYSENIRIISILGRFLEHDRIFYFHNNNQPITLIGSADWRNRNLSERVELFVPVEDANLQKRLIQLLNTALSDNRLAWKLDSNGQYTLRRATGTRTEYNMHKILMDQANDSRR